MKHKDLVKRLTSNGFKKIRDGNHEIFYKPGTRIIEVPKLREINEFLAKKILKQAGL